MSDKKCPPLVIGLLGFLVGVIAVKIVARFCPFCRPGGCCGGEPCCCGDGEGECCGGHGEGGCCGEHGEGECCGHQEETAQEAASEAGAAE